MTSAKQIAANRRNGPKSRGPRTAAGKSSARHNALRHGLAAVTCRYLRYSPLIERIARAICAGEEDPRLFEQALAIAENEVVLLRVRAQRVAAIERPMAKDPSESRDAFAAMRDEFAAMRHAMSDFGRLARYERGAWSNRKQAIGHFLEIKVELRQARLAKQQQGSAI
jgi:hypothetical protein